MSLVLSIRLGSKPLAPLEVQRSDDVLHLKQKICECQNLNPETDQIKLLFQGKELCDTWSLQDSDLSDFSVLHAFVIKNATTHPDNSTLESGDATVTSLAHDIRVQTEQPNSLLYSGERNPEITTMFYVYCQSVCRRVQPARLRVRCTSCQQGTLQLNREPTGWTDVIVAKQITGTCLVERCSGTYAEFYFKCNGHTSQEENGNSVVLQQIVANIHNEVCLTCADLSSPVLVFACQASHVMCLACFEEYCRVKLSERAFVYSSDHGYTLGCPAGCENTLIEEAHHFKVLGTEQYERYQHFATEECLIRDGGVLCPAPGCGEGLFPGDVRRVQCVRPSCLFVFCKECHQEYHQGECEVSALDEAATNDTHRFHRPWSAQQNADHHASLQTIVKTTKPCPNCKVPVEKTGGCMHMVCSRCDFEWCWLCHSVWTRDCMGAHWFG